MRAEVYFESRQKDQNRRSACVGQADFGKLGLNNIRNDSGNSQHLSVLSVKRDQFETRSIAAEINVLECSDLRAFVDGGGNYYPWPFKGFYASVAFTWFGLRHARLKVVGPSTYSGFEIWVFRIGVLGASFSSPGCFVFES